MYSYVFSVISKAVECTVEANCSEYHYVGLVDDYMQFIVLFLEVQRLFTVMLLYDPHLCPLSQVLYVNSVSTM